MYWSETTYSTGLGRKYKTLLTQLFIYLVTCQIHLSISNLRNVFRVRDQHSIHSRERSKHNKLLLQYMFSIYKLLL